MKRLRESYPETSHYEIINNYVDLKHKWRVLPRNNMAYENVDVCSGSSLSTVLYYTCGKKLNKNMQLSNWECRPLLPEQIAYAANDVYCLLEIWDKLGK